VGRPAVHQHAFWLYGVVVGLAIREALNNSVPALLGAPGPGTTFPSRALLVIRVTVLLLLVMRFYLGSAAYFGQAHPIGSASDGQRGRPGMAYASDFLAGLLHFILCYSLALQVSLLSLPQPIP
jgi:hypothetical protein